MRRIRKITWRQYDSFIGKIAQFIGNKKIDLIVGITRGSLPIAVSLSHKLGVRDVGVLHVTKTRDDSPFAIDNRFVATLGGYILPKLPEKNVTIVLVDDIIAYGDTMKKSQTFIRLFYKGKNITLIRIVIAFNTERYHERNKTIVDPVELHLLKTNKHVWVEFPWE